MNRPRLLDLFCCQGGAGEGCRRAGFDVTGVDIEPQPRNPHRFIQADALAYVAKHGHEYDAIHASPPCQAYSVAAKGWNGRDDHPDLVAPTRAALIASGRPYVMENVVGAPMTEAITLCGSSFGLAVRRHRLFECSYGDGHRLDGQARFVASDPAGVHRVHRLVPDRRCPVPSAWCGVTSRPVRVVSLPQPEGAVVTVERSQEAVEAAEASFMAACKFNTDAKAIGGIGVTITARKMTEDALAAADAVDPCVPVRVLREWATEHGERWRHADAYDEAAFDVLRALACLLDEHANERTDT